MLKLFQHIEQPTLNIESIGCYDPYAELQDNIRKPQKFYVASLDYKINSLFGTTNKVVYIPILFEKESEIKSIFSHYDDLYFRIVWPAYYNTSEKHYFNLYHISEFVNIDKIYRNTMASINLLYYIEIQFIIKYNNIEITLYNKKWAAYSYVSFEGFRTDHFDINSLYANNKNNIIKEFQTNVTGMPVFNTYNAYIENDNKTICVDKLNSVIKHIDEYTDRKKKESDLIESYYTKKSYKLVEEN